MDLVRLLHRNNTSGIALKAAVGLASPKLGNTSCTGCVQLAPAGSSLIVESARVTFFVSYPLKVFL